MGTNPQGDQPPHWGAMCPRSGGHQPQILTGIPQVLTSTSTTACPRSFRRRSWCSLWYVVWVCCRVVLGCVCGTVVSGTVPPCTPLGPCCSLRLRRHIVAQASCRSAESQEHREDDGVFHCEVINSEHADGAQISVVQTLMEVCSSVLDSCWTTTRTLADVLRHVR